MSRRKIAITGSNGVIGKIIVDELSKKGYELVLLDKSNPDNPIDLLHQNFAEYLVGVDTIIHLAAHVSPYISKELAQENIKLSERIIEVSKGCPSLRMIINASSVNVYPYYEMYYNKKTISNKTPLSPNLKLAPGEYSKAKIICESLFNDYGKDRNILIINLRFGHVNFDDIIPQSKENAKEDNEIEKLIFLYHTDLRKIINKTLTLNTSGAFLCVSHDSKLFNKNICFPI